MYFGLDSDELAISHPAADPSYAVSEGCLMPPEQHLVDSAKTVL